MQLEIIVQRFKDAANHPGKTGGGNRVANNQDANH
jgi:hypothetical protein